MWSRSDAHGRAGRRRRRRPSRGHVAHPDGCVVRGGRGGCTAHPDGGVSIRVGPHVCSHHLVEHSVDGIVKVGIAQVERGRIEPTHALHNRRAKARHV